MAINFNDGGFVTITDEYGDDSPEQQRKLSFRLNSTGKTIYFEVREADDLREDDGTLALININVNTDEFIAGLMHTFEVQSKRTL